MPDMSPADVAAIVGTFLAAIITGLGLKRGDAERKIRDLHADLVRWHEEDEIARRADKERSTDERFAKVEGNQARIVGLLHQLRDAEPERPNGRR